MFSNFFQSSVFFPFFFPSFIHITYTLVCSLPIPFLSVLFHIYIFICYSLFDLFSPLLISLSSFFSSFMQATLVFHSLVLFFWLLMSLLSLSIFPLFIYLFSSLLYIYSLFLVCLSLFYYLLSIFPSSLFLFLSSSVFCYLYLLFYIVYFSSICPFPLYISPYF